MDKGMNWDTGCEIETCSKDSEMRKRLDNEGFSVAPLLSGQREV